ncbi:MAG TPA: hypothetical protein VF297_07120 [Pyrinomonadaceae bacterium]
MAECKVYRREIDETPDAGTLSAGARSHAALCRACGDELRVRESLRALVGGLGKVEAPADFEFRLRARMAAAKSDGRASRVGGRWLYGFVPVAVAACFVVVSATLYFRQATRTNTPAASAVASAPAPGVEPVRPTSINVQASSPKSSVESKEVVEATQTVAAGPRGRKPVYRANARATQQREIANEGERRGDSGQNTLVSSVTGAQVIHLSVKTSAEPLRVILRDERGAERVVPMRSVSFGSQDFLSRGAALKQPGAAEVGGVW